MYIYIYARSCSLFFLPECIQAEISAPSYLFSRGGFFRPKSFGELCESFLGQNHPLLFGDQSCCETIELPISHGSKSSIRNFNMFQHQLLCQNVFNIRQQTGFMGWAYWYFIYCSFLPSTLFRIMAEHGRSQGGW